jgi:hypothetical protein
VTADRYSHALLDYKEFDRAKLLDRLRTALPRCSPQGAEEPTFRGTF